MSAPTPPSRLRAVAAAASPASPTLMQAAPLASALADVGGGKGARRLAAAVDQGAGALDLRGGRARRIDAQQSPGGGEQRVAVVGQHDAAIGHLARFAGLNSAFHEAGAPPMRWTALSAS